MPQTSHQPSDLASAYEFKLPCGQGTAACTGEAQWAARATHGAHCPEFAYVCNPCKAYLEIDWTETLIIGATCINCHTQATGILSDHLTFLPL